MDFGTSTAEYFGRLNPPSPGVRKDSEPQKPEPANNPDERHKNQRGTKEAPLAIEIINASEIKPEPPHRADKSEEKAPPDWWPWPKIVPSADWALTLLTALLVVVGVVQIFVFGLQAVRLKQTVSAMKEIDQGQSAKVAESIAQSARAAKAMEDVASATRISFQANFKVAEAAEESARAGWSASGAANRTAQIMKDTAERQLRAYVNVSEARIVRLSSPHQLRVEIKVKNFGQTPAHKMTFWIGAHVHDYPLNLNEWPPANIPENLGGGVLPPGREWEHNYDMLRIDDAQIASITSTEAAIWVFGQITYYDAFTTFRTTDYRFLCYGNGLSNGGLTPHQYGNDAT